MMALIGMFLWRAIMGSILYKGKTVISGGGGGGGSLPINSVPSPFINSDCHFWFERGIKNLANTFIGLSSGTPIQSYMGGNTQTTALKFFSSNANTLAVDSSASFLNFSSNRALSIWWLQESASNAYHGICAKDDNTSLTNREWNLTYINDGSALNGKIVFTVWNSDGVAILSLADTTVSTLSVFTHWVVTRSGSTFTLFKNGAAIASGSLSGAYNSTPMPIFLADFASRAVPGKGDCSQFIGFNRALTLSEIADLYNSGNGLFSL
jgi:hypothetical protein